MPRTVYYQLSDDEDNICDDQEEGEHSEVDVLHKPPEGPVEIRSITPFLWRPGRVITLCIQTQLAKSVHSNIYNVGPDMSSPTLLHFQLLRSSSDDLKHKQQVWRLLNNSLDDARYLSMPNRARCSSSG